MEQISQVLFALDKMADINDQRVNRYKHLAEKSKDVESKLFFMQYAIQAQTFTATLNKWRVAYGATPHTPKKGSLMSQAYSHFMKVVSLGSKAFELRECEVMESNALKTYRTATALSFLPVATLQDITSQTNELEKAHYTLKAFRENGAHQWQAAFA
ncbi:MAG: hypothetical protein HOP08_03900 [Cyclobacteriaceae bacterium]|nr:hypothetical protein [Cyclobacteriaceae bacterium]